jgi:hypothetical protein
MAIVDDRERRFGGLQVRNAHCWKPRFAAVREQVFLARISIGDSYERLQR